jgi:hypothetical protein
MRPSIIVKFEQGMQSWKVGIAHGCTDKEVVKGDDFLCLCFVPKILKKLL